MIDHLGITVRDVAQATEFYLKCLAPLGYGIVMEVSAEETGGEPAIGFGPPGEEADFQTGKPSFWIGGGKAPSGPIHAAFVAETRAAVDAFYRAALALGPRITGPQASGRNITRPITRPSSSMRTATISRPSATAQNKARQPLGQLGKEKAQGGGGVT